MKSSPIGAGPHVGAGVTATRVTQRTAADALEQTSSQHVLDVDSNQVLVANAQSVVVLHATGAVTSSEPSLRAVPSSRTYPHIFDESHPEGRALSHISRALLDARQSLDAFEQADFDEVESRFAQIAVSLREAHDLALFNQSLASVCTYIRRSVLGAAVDDLSRGGLNSLIAAFAQLIDNPLLSLSQGADLVEELSTEGWVGDDPVVDRLVALWLDVHKDVERTDVPLGAST